MFLSLSNLRVCNEWIAAKAMWWTGQLTEDRNAPTPHMAPQTAKMPGAKALNKAHCSTKQSGQSNATTFPLDFVEQPIGTH